MNQHDKKTLHRRWIIAGIVVLAIITWLHLWIFVELGIIFLVFCAIVNFLIDWLTGADLDGSADHPEDFEISDDEKDFWDYLFWSELFKNK